MDLKLQLANRNLKWNWDKIADYIVEHPVLLKELVDQTFNGELHIKKNASAVLGKICDRNRKLLTPYLVEIGNHLKTNPIDAVKRNSLRVFQYCDIPEEIEGPLFDLIIDYLKSADEAIAIKAFGMTVTRKICQNHPELSGELRPRLEILLEQKVSSGITARASREIKILRKIAGQF